MTLSNNDNFDTTDVEIVDIDMGNDNASLEDATELPFGDEADESYSPNQGTSFLGSIFNTRNKVILGSSVALLLLATASIGATASTSAFASYAKAPKSTKSPKSTKAPTP